MQSQIHPALPMARKSLSPVDSWGWMDAFRDVSRERASRTARDIGEAPNDRMGRPTPSEGAVARVPHARLAGSGVKAEQPGVCRRDSMRSSASERLGREMLVAGTSTKASARPFPSFGAESSDAGVALLLTARFWSETWPFCGSGVRRQGVACRCPVSLAFGVGVAMLALFENLDDRHVQEAECGQTDHNFGYRRASHGRSVGEPKPRPLPRPAALSVRGFQGTPDGGK